MLKRFAAQICELTLLKNVELVAIHSDQFATTMSGTCRAEQQKALLERTLSRPRDNKPSTGF
jgi:hypothetical protein